MRDTATQSGTAGSTAPQDGRSGYIDSWRFVAVALVIAAHYVKMIDPAVADPESPFFFLGQVGVYIFFFISGFVVSKASLSEVARTGSFSVPAFYIRRAFRIVPPLSIYLGACALLTAWGVIELDLKDFVGATLYMCNMEWFQCSWYLAHTWSLAFEEQFYLLFALLFLWREKGQPPNMTLLALFGAFAALPFFFAAGPQGQSGYPLIYALFLTGYLFAKQERRWLSVPLPMVRFLVGALVTFAPPLWFLEPETSKFYKLAYAVSIPLMVVATGSALFSLKGWLEFRAVRYLGLISYSIFLWQQLLTGLFAAQAEPFDFLLLLVFLLGGCALLFELVERPLVRLGRRLAEGYNSGRAIEKKSA